MSAQSTFVLGGTRSGKSTWAEALVERSAKQKIYLATGQGLDSEMRQRIDQHRSRRGETWQTIEEPLEIVPHLQKLDDTAIVLLDCITLWISNLMAARLDVAGHVEQLCKVVDEGWLELVIVSNEVGLGIVPDNALARAFRDEAGSANQMIAGACEKVVLVTAGLPMILKG